MAPRDSLVRTLLQETPTGPIVNIAYISPSEIASATSDGNVSYWDHEGKAGKPFGDNLLKNGISSFVVHPRASVLAYGTVVSPEIAVCTRRGELCKTIKFHDGFISQKISPINNLCFHPHNIMIASGFSDSLVCIYSLE